MAGFTLIEVLVAVLVLAIGMLGVAALIVQGAKYNHDAYLRSQVSTLAYSITDRMRVNTGNANLYVTAYVAQPPVAGGNNPCDYTIAPPLFTNDLNCWYNEIDSALPPGSTASIVNSGLGVYTVALGWTDRENQLHTVSYAFQPQ